MVGFFFFSHHRRLAVKRSAPASALRGGTAGTAETPVPPSPRRVRVPRERGLSAARSGAVFGCRPAAESASPPLPGRGTPAGRQVCERPPLSAGSPAAGPGLPRCRRPSPHRPGPTPQLAHQSPRRPPPTRGLPLSAAPPTPPTPRQPSPGRRRGRPHEGAEGRRGEAGRRCGAAAGPVRPLDGALRSAWRRGGRGEGEGAAAAAGAGRQRGPSSPIPGAQHPHPRSHRDAHLWIPASPSPGSRDPHPRGHAGGGARWLSSPPNNNNYSGSRRGWERAGRRCR